MSIQEISVNFKRFFSDSEVQLAFIIIVVALGSFWLGTISVTNTAQYEKPFSNPVFSETSTPFESENDVILKSSEVKSITSETPLTATISTQGVYVASKSGTKYHLPWCGSAKQIKEENKIWFQSKEEAEKAGYTPAANCKGI